MGILVFMRQGSKSFEEIIIRGVVWFDEMIIRRVELFLRR
jgi:hypothetical protein